MIDLITAFVWVHNFNQQLKWERRAMGNISSKIALMILVILVSTASEGETWEEMEEIRTLSVSERIELRRKATSGDSEASYRLALFYGDYQSYDFIQYFFFLMLSAEQGNCNALEDFYHLQKGPIDEEFRIDGEWKKMRTRCAMDRHMSQSGLRLEE